MVEIVESSNDADTLVQIEESSNNADTLVEIEESSNANKLCNDNSSFIESFDEDIDLNEISYILRLYSLVNINRNDVSKIVENTYHLIEAKCGVSRTPFGNLNTEFKFKKALTTLNLLAEPQSLVLDYRQQHFKKQ